MVESVVFDNESIRHYDPYRGLFQLEWHQLREVAAEWITQGFSPTPYATLTGDTAELIIRAGCVGFSALLERLAELKEFPSANFLELLKTTKYDEKVVVWNRDICVLPGADRKGVPRVLWGQMGRCPKCQFSYRWDGVVCMHCGYSMNS